MKDDATAFAATPVEVRATISLVEQQPQPSCRLSELGARIMDLLSDGQPWRTKHLVEQAAEGRRRSAVSVELGLLCKEGRIAKPRNGVCILAGMPVPDPAAIPPLRSEHSGGPTVQKVLARLFEPTLAPVLVNELRVSRQRVDQILKELLKQKKAVRIRNPHSRARWLWARADLDVSATLRNRPPDLSSGRAKTLDALEPGEFHLIGDIAEASGQANMGVRGQIDDLETSGLVMTVRLGQRRYVSITPQGMDHPARTLSARRAAIADFSKAFGERRLAVLETLAVLGSARTIDITGSIAGGERRGLIPAGRKFDSSVVGRPAGIPLISRAAAPPTPRAYQSAIRPPGISFQTGLLMTRLRRSGFVRVLPGQQDLPQPDYRLTDAGRLAAALIARTRPPPSVDALRGRLGDYLARRSERLRGSGGRGPAGKRSSAASPAQQAILDALKAGPMATLALLPVAGPHLRNRRSIHQTLGTLAKRGAIREIPGSGSSKMWSLALPPETPGQSDN